MTAAPPVFRLWSPGYPDPTDIPLVEDKDGAAYVAPSGWEIVRSWSPKTAANCFRVFAERTGRIAIGIWPTKDGTVGRADLPAKEVRP